MCIRDRDDYVAANSGNGGSQAQHWTFHDPNGASEKSVTVIFGDMSDGNGGVNNDVVVFSTDESLVGTAKTDFTAIGNGWVPGTNKGIYPET